MLPHQAMIWLPVTKRHCSMVRLGWRTVTLSLRCLWNPPSANCIQFRERYRRHGTTKSCKAEAAQEEPTKSGSKSSEATRLRSRISLNLKTRTFNCSVVRRTKLRYPKQQACPQLHGHCLVRGCQQRLGKQGRDGEADSQSLSDKD